MDSWHRTGSNVTDKLKRYMLKLHYVRMEQPCVQGPSWDHDPRQRAWSIASPLGDRAPLASRATWDWLCGNAAPERGEGDARPYATVAGLLAGPCSRGPRPSFCTAILHSN
jgi:hypothetical protein